MLLITKYTPRATAMNFIKNVKRHIDDTVGESNGLLAGKQYGFRKDTVLAIGIVRNGHQDLKRRFKAVSNQLDRADGMNDQAPVCGSTCR